MGKQRTGDEHIRFDGMPIGHLLGDYWAWNSSDLLVNTERGSFSEFIVSAALDLDLSGTKVDWGPYDVSFPFRWMCEGKPRGSADRGQECRLPPVVGAGEAVQHCLQYQAGTGLGPRPRVLRELKRQSDLYVFCHYTQTDRAKADPLVLDDWTFYILPTKRLDQCCGGQKTISLSSLLALGPVQVDFDGIKDAVIHCIQGDECTPPRHIA